MKRSIGWSSAILLALLSVASATGVVAQTSTVNVQLGVEFTGSVGAGDTLGARFSAGPGTLTVTVRATRGSTLRPTVVVRDAAGNTLATDAEYSIEWLPVENVIHYCTIPSSGSYTAEIGAASGSGEFRAEISGTAGAEMSATVLSGAVRDGVSGDALPGVTVFVDNELFAVTDAAGSYDVSFDAAGFQPYAETFVLMAGTTGVLNVDLVPLIPVVLDAGVSGDAIPGSVLTATVDVTLPAGDAIQSVAWSQISGVTVGISGADTATATVTLSVESAYRDELILFLSEPPLSEEQLPPNVPLPEGEFPGGLQNRFAVVGISPFALEEAALVVLQVDVTTSFGTFSDTVEIHTALPWKPASGLRNVPVGARVLLQGKEQAAYDWALYPPPGSSATLTDPTSRNPDFMPDIDGLYEIEVTDEATAGLVTLQVHAGTWRGVVVGQDIDGRPVADTACTFCHDGSFAADKFTPWAQTGHAEIFTNNLNTSTHYGTYCFGCHTVGFDPGVDNDGIDNATDYQDFLDSGMLNVPGDNWTRVLQDYPETALMANIQCDNCHGPQSSTAHGFGAPQGQPRIDLSSDVCAVCHGEPLRHARFQQWQLSAHANYEQAIDKSGSGNCSRCHTANGFLEWLPILLDNDPNTDPLASISVSWSADESHPQTCVTCHDPHAVGTTSGSNTNATVRISGDTPPLIAGFQVSGAGRGAICMTCHNSRRGLRNDDTFADFVGTSEAARAPHGSAQTDLLMGQNAYLVAVDNPGGHALVQDTCATCHMESTAPPDMLAYRSGGTNHTFYASTDICSDCHSPRLLAEDVQNGIQTLLDDLQDLIEDGMLELIDGLIASANTIDLNGDATIVDVTDVTAIEFGEYRGRQSITVSFTGGGVSGPHRLTDVDVVDGTPAVIGQLYDFADASLIKAGWNWNLVHNDGSLGVHNPFFARETLLSARDALAGTSARSVLVQRSLKQQSWNLWRGAPTVRRQRR